MYVFQVLTLGAVIIATPSESTSIEYITMNHDFADLILGGGLNSSDLSIVGCVSYYVSPTTNCQLVTRDGSSCNITYFKTTEIERYGILSLQQLPGKKLLLKVREYLKNMTLNMKDYLTLFDASSCTSIYNVSMPGRVEQIVAYEDGGYDVLLKDWNGKSASLEHYNASGQRSADTQNITALDFDNMDLNIEAASTKSSSRGVFVRGRTSEGLTAVKFLANPGLQSQEVKDILNLNLSFYHTISDVENEKYYGVCGKNYFNTEIISCARYDMQTNQVTKRQFELSQDQKIEHLRVSNNAVMLFGVEFGKGDSIKNFFAVKVPDAGHVIVRIIDLPNWGAHPDDDCQLIDFDVATNSFNLACELRRAGNGVVGLKKIIIPF